MMLSHPTVYSKILLRGFDWNRRMVGVPNSCGSGINQLTRNLSSGEVFTALKPFFFAVHPDIFGQFPMERKVNENSLKQLNAYIESSTHQRAVNSTSLTFYLRKTGTSPAPVEGPGFRAIQIDIGQRDVRQTVYSILEKCSLPRKIDSAATESEISWMNKPNFQNRGQFYPPEAESYEEPSPEKDIERNKSTQIDLETWLSENVTIARMKFESSSPIRVEVDRLRESLCKTLELNKIGWDCGWGTTHFRGVLESFQSLYAHHPETLKILKDKTVIFGRETGVTLNGDVILNAGDVRTNWLEVIKRIGLQDAVIARIPYVQKALSTSLKDIKVVHRKFEQKRLAETYESELRKLTTSIGDYTGRKSFPAEWPEKLSHLELVVETHAGPLMVSPTGQIIVPSSCPPFLMINFISQHMEEAKEKLDAYNIQKYEERDLHAKCVQAFGLHALEKADNITPNLMIECCKRLLARVREFESVFRETHLCITTYYSVLSDGEICIPWNWKEHTSS